MKILVKPLAFSSLFFALLLPPEVYPNGKLAVVLTATFSFLIAVSEHKIPLRFLQAGAFLFSLLLIHSFTISIDLYRSLDTLTLVWAYYCIVGYFTYTSHGATRQLAIAVVVLSIIVSGYGLYQYFWGFDQIHQFIAYSASDQIVKAPALGVIAMRRVSSTLALPGTLWCFLVCAVPFHGMLWRQPWLYKVLVAVSTALLLAAGFLTRSFGFLLGLSVLAGLTMFLRYRRILWNRFTPVLVLVVISGALFYSTRRGTIEQADPAGLRLKNWISAWNIFSVHPLGTGLNTYGVIYPEYMQPGANETQYVHNTPLELLSELGLPLIAALALILVIKAPAVTRLYQRRIDGLTQTQNDGVRTPREAEMFWLTLALAAWITHNLVDINVYFGSVGVLGAVIIGTLCARRIAPHQLDKSWQARASVAFMATLAVAAMIFSATSCVASELQQRAQVEFDNKKLTTALETLKVARQLCPINSSLHHDAGEILLNLYQATKDKRHEAAAMDTFRTAVMLSPLKAGSHVGYGLSLSSAGRLSEAVDQIRTAQQLYPSSSYIQAIALLMERRIK